MNVSTGTPRAPSFGATCAVITPGGSLGRLSLLPPPEARARSVYPPTMGGPNGSAAVTLIVKLPARGGTKPPSTRNSKPDGSPEIGPCTARTSPATSAPPLKVNSASLRLLLIPTIRLSPATATPLVSSRAPFLRRITRISISGAGGGGLSAGNVMFARATLGYLSSAGATWSRGTSKAAAVFVSAPTVADTVTPPPVNLVSHSVYVPFPWLVATVDPLADKGCPPTSTAETCAPATATNPPDSVTRSTFPVTVPTLGAAGRTGSKLHMKKSVPRPKIPMNGSEAVTSFVSPSLVSGNAWSTVSNSTLCSDGAQVAAPFRHGPSMRR